MMKDTASVHPVNDVQFGQSKEYGPDEPFPVEGNGPVVAANPLEKEQLQRNEDDQSKEEQNRADALSKSQALLALYEKPPYLLDPRQPFMQRWDILIAFLLLFTSIVTPFEVAYLETSLNVMFVLNRFVDVCFTVDMLFNFDLAYYDPHLGSGTWVMERSKIVNRYLKGSFWVDLVSILPFDSLGLAMEDNAIQRLKILRVIRLLRLFKLLRILRSGRILKRLESNINIDYNLLTLCKFVIGTMFIAHWLACAFHMLTKIEGRMHDWVTYYFSAYEREGDSEVYDEVKLCPDGIGSEGCESYAEWLGMSVVDLYVASMYWALVTMSTIGYGDIIPTSTGERFFIIFAMLIGTSVFAYVVGSVCGLVAAMDKKNNEFYELMDNLNNFMQETKLEVDLRIRLRAYFRYRRRNTSMDDWHYLLELMSPGLRGEAAIQQCGAWIQNVVFFKGAPKDFVVDIALLLRSETYPQNEEIIRLNEVATKMYIVERGVVGGKGRVYTSGRVFGEDILAGEHESEYMMRALTFTDVFSLKREDLEDVVVKYPKVKRNLREAACRQMAKDAILDFVRAWSRIQDGGGGTELASHRESTTELQADMDENDIVSPQRQALKRKQLGIQRFALVMAGLNPADLDVREPRRTPAFEELPSLKERRSHGGASREASSNALVVMGEDATAAEAAAAGAGAAAAAAAAAAGVSSGLGVPHGGAVDALVSRLSIQLDTMTHSINQMSSRLERLEKQRA